MRKKIKLSVKEVLRRQPQYIKHKCNRQVVVKGETFEELYNMIVKNRKVSDNSSASTTYLHSKKCTPQNTGRNHINPLRINHSLQKLPQNQLPLRQRSLSAPKKRSKNTFQIQQNHHSNIINQKIEFMNQFQQTIKRLNHSKHQHIRQKQCFLGEQQLVFVLTVMKYIDGKCNKLVKRVYKQLGGVTYGGVPSQNLKQFLMIVNGDSKRKRDRVMIVETSTKQEMDQKYIDFNLKFKVSETQKKNIYTAYGQLRNNRKNYRSNLQVKSINQKQNRNIDSNMFEHIKDIQLTPQKQQINQQQYSFPPEKAVPIQKQIPTKIINYQDSFQNLFLKEKGLMIPLQRQVIQQKPILSVDVNLGEGIVEKIIVYEGETPSNVADRLAKKFRIQQTMKLKFEKMLEAHIRCLLWKIQEVSEELFSDRQ